MDNAPEIRNCITCTNEFEVLMKGTRCEERCPSCQAQHRINQANHRDYLASLKAREEGIEAVATASAAGAFKGALDGLPAYEDMRNPAYDGPDGIFADYTGP